MTYALSFSHDGIQPQPTNHNEQPPELQSQIPDSKFLSNLRQQKTHHTRACCLCVVPRVPTRERRLSLSVVEGEEELSSHNPS